MTRPIPTFEHARGALRAIRANHVCTEACTGTVTLGDGKVLNLRCPWEQIDLTKPADRRLVVGVYAAEARAARTLAGAR